MIHSRSFSPLRGLLVSLVSGLLLGLAGLFVTPPAPVYAACSVIGNAFDANATNGSNTNPGGTSVTLAYNTGTTWNSSSVSVGTGYTNASTISWDLWPQSGADCAAVQYTYYYVDMSRTHEALFDKTTSGANGTNSISADWGAVDGLGTTGFSGSAGPDWVNDWSGGFNLISPSKTLASSASAINLYYDITKCQLAQSTTAGFSPNWVRRTTGDTTTIGAFYWTALSSSSANSRWTATGSTISTAGGGKGFCNNHVATNWSPYYHSYDSIIYDATTPTISTFSTPSPTNQGTVSLSINATDTVPMWLMAFSNNPSCLVSSTSSSMWSPWETYATSKSWTVDTTAYGGTSGDGTKTVCMRVMDRAGNMAMSTLLVTIDITAPTITNFTSSSSSPTNATSISYSISFSEWVGSITAADFTNAGTATGCVFAVAGSGSSRTLTVTGCGTSGTLIPRMAAGGYSDIAGNQSGSATSGATLTLDRIAPTVLSFVPDPATDTGTSSSDGITNSSAPAFTLTFNESVNGLTGADFSRTGTATNCATPTISGSGATYTVSVSGCGEGTLTLTLNSNTVTDLATNLGPAAAAAASSSFTIDRTGPTGCSLIIASGAVWTTTATNPLAISCTGIALGDQVRFSNNALAYSPIEAYTTSKSWDVTAAAYGGSTAEGTKTVTLQATDIAGNNATATDTIIYDGTAPAVSFSSPVVTGFASAPGYTVTYSASDSGTGIPAGGTTVRRYVASATSATCPASGYTLENAVVDFPSGTLSTGLAHGKCYYWTLIAADAAGNTASTTSAAILVDQVAPEISSVIIGDGSGATISTAISAVATASDALSGLAKIRWSAESGRDWSDSCLQSPSSLPYNTGRNKPDISLGAGAGDYGVMVQVCDYAGNVRSYSGVVTLTSAKTPPGLTLGARIVDCAATGSVLAVNSSGVVYWPVGKELCLLPLPALARPGSDSTGGEPLTGIVDPNDTGSYTLLSTNPCPAGSACAGVVGLYPTAAVGVSRGYSLAAGQQSFTYAMSGCTVAAPITTCSWTVPENVTSISAVTIGAGGGGRATTSGGGGGGGGALAWAAQVSVTPGEVLTVEIGRGGAASGTTAGTGGTTTIKRGGTTLLSAGGGAGASSLTGGLGGVGGGSERDGGGDGGNGGTGATAVGGGGGGAGGYSGTGGAGGSQGATTAVGAAGSSATGGAGGGGASGGSSNGGAGGGGVGLIGIGSNGSGGTVSASVYGLGGGAGSFGADGANGTAASGGAGGAYGGGGGGADDTGLLGAGANGAAKIIWGPGRNFPSSGMADQSSGGNAEPLRIRLDRETTTAANSVSSVSLVVRLSVRVRWYNAAGTLVRTDAAYPVTLELRLRSLAAGVRPY